MRVEEQRPFGAMKAVKDRREEFHDPARIDNILGRKQIRLELCEKHLGQSSEVPRKSLSGLTSGSRFL